MAATGWKQLLAGAPWFRGEGRYPIAAYSEFMPPPRIARKAHDSTEPTPFTADDPWGWHVPEFEEMLQLRPGLEAVAGQVVAALARLGRGEPAHGISKNKLTDNPYWPPELAEHAGKLRHERYVALLPLALAKTQDDKGRVRWTVFGGSEQGPARAFWKGFFTAPNKEADEEHFLGFVRRLLHAAHAVPLKELDDLHRAGFRIHADDGPPGAPFPGHDPLPGWAAPFRLGKNNHLRGVRYLLTFEPFGQLPPAVRRAYLAGELHLLPFPGSLVFWGAQAYWRLQKELPFALQIPLLHLLGRNAGWRGLRVPQAGWLHEPRPGGPEPDERFVPVRNTYKRTHRWARVYRHEDELAVLAREDTLLHVLFSTLPDDVGLYNKPMARNVQLWTPEHHLLLDGPHASAQDIERAVQHIHEHGGLYGYRFQWPAMRVGRHEVYWHRPLAAYRTGMGEPAVLPDAPLGYLTAYRDGRPDLAHPVELWPRLLQREPHLEALRLFGEEGVNHPYQAATNVRKLLDTADLLGRPLSRSFARSLLKLHHHDTLEAWLDSFPERTGEPARGRRLADDLRRILEPAPYVPPKRPPESLTYHRTARRAFEVAYWKTIAFLAEGKYRNKNNADCVHDPMTWTLLAHHRRDLEALGDHILAHYRKVIAAHGLEGKALAGDLPFTWRTDFDFSWMGGWMDNQEGVTHERDLIAVIPGRDRGRAVIMADHYDTAFMADRYEAEHGGNGARLAAWGADDNHSATAALMLAAPVLLELSRQGKLGCDVWLIHLTGEEFPADCLGARHLAQEVVQGTLRMRTAKGRWRDLSKVRVKGLYVLDMVAHNNDRERDVFQIAPGTSREAMWLAEQAHLANRAWNESVPFWNERPGRRGRGRGRRSPDGTRIPEAAEHPVLTGEVRPAYSPRSTLYNTDGQIFSDAGIPAVLFMENYDINRAGYHDTHDTMENIDLDYGAAVAAIAIESVARAAGNDVQ
ncbi:MAG TPA: M28 family peptidase [Gemmataceae bacterium]|nr:M28 family peptidase [Gemmataceae bacterium]